MSAVRTMSGLPQGVGHEGQSSFDWRRLAPAAIAAVLGLVYVLVSPPSLDLAAHISRLAVHQGPVRDLEQLLVLRPPRRRLQPPVPRGRGGSDAPARGGDRRDGHGGAVRVAGTPALRPRGVARRGPVRRRNGDGPVHREACVCVRRTAGDGRSRRIRSGAPGTRMRVRSPDGALQPGRRRVRRPRRSGVRAG